jgi:hypothetical protein
MCLATPWSMLGKPNCSMFASLHLPDQILSACGSKTQQGMLSSAAAVLFGFVPATVFAKDKMADFQADAEETYNSCTHIGIKRQYAMQKQWLTDSSYAQAEYEFLPSLARIASEYTV